MIQDVRSGGIAAQARIMPNDVVTHINNKAVLNAEQFVQEVSELKKGNVARVTLMRQGQRAIRSEERRVGKGCRSRWWRWRSRGQARVRSCVGCEGGGWARGRP